MKLAQFAKESTRGKCAILDAVAQKFSAKESFWRHVTHIDFEFTLPKSKATLTNFCDDNSPPPPRQRNHGSPSQQRKGHKRLRDPLLPRSADLVQELARTGRRKHLQACEEGRNAITDWCRLER